MESSRADWVPRRWIACDASPVAIHATRARLVRLPEPRPFVVMRQGLDREHGNDRLTVRVQAEGLTSRVELTGLEPPQGHESTKAHWAQWIDGWAVDWDGQSAELRAQSSVWRSKRGSSRSKRAMRTKAPGDGSCG